MWEINKVYRETVQTGMGPAEVSVFREGSDGRAFSINVYFELGGLSLSSESVRIEVWDVVRMGMEKLREANKVKESFK